jgi:hypothetical protein
MTSSPALGPRAVPPTPGSDISGTGGEPALKDVLVELWQNLEKLLRQEMKLASAELDIKAQRLKKELIASAVGAGLILAGALALVAAVILLLALVLPAWAAALVTGGATAGAGFVLLQSSKPAVSDLVPERTVHNLEKDVQTFRESTK